MLKKDSHIPDADLLMTADGESSRQRGREIRKHLEGCRLCRARMKELQDTMADFIHAHHAELDAKAQPSHGSRALLKAQLAELAAEPRAMAGWRWLAYSGCALAFLLVLGMLIFHGKNVFESLQPEPEAIMIPNSRLTPGATRPVTTAELCTPGSSDKTRFISASVGQKIFEEYGVADPRPRSYELDYLIDPELGGSNDPDNLWPQPYSAVWNARVKDALENRMHQLVCTEQISLGTAQRDIAANWISAYKKYFHTDNPIPDHLAFIKDIPWSN